LLEPGARSGKSRFSKWSKGGQLDRGAEDFLPAATTISGFPALAENTSNSTVLDSLGHPHSHLAIPFRSVL
jgi:hypothetical protein